MSIWASTETVDIVAKVEPAHAAVMEAYGSGKIRKSNYAPERATQLEDVKDMASLLNFHNYAFEQSGDQLEITNCDIDRIHNEFCDIFETLAPFITAGGSIEIKDEEGGELLMRFDGEKLTFEGDAY